MSGLAEQPPYRQRRLSNAVTENLLLAANLWQIFSLRAPNKAIVT
jgi:hypothetical protein